jgi:hypothetical protein
MFAVSFAGSVFSRGKQSETALFGAAKGKSGVLLGKNEDAGCPFVLSGFL